MYRTATWTFKNTKDFSLNVLSTSIDNGCFNMTIALSKKKKVLDDCDGYLVYVDMIETRTYTYRFPSEYIISKIYKKYRRNKGNFLKNIKEYSTNVKTDHGSNND